MLIHSPCIIDFVAFFREGLHHLHVLIEPVSRLIIGAIGPQRTVIVASVLEKNTDGFAIGASNDSRIGISAAKVRKAADNAQNFVELIRTRSSDSKRGNGSGTSAADPMVFWIPGNIVVLIENRQ